MNPRIGRKIENERLGGVMVANKWEGWGNLNRCWNDQPLEHLQHTYELAVTCYMSYV